MKKYLVVVILAIVSTKCWGQTITIDQGILEGAQRTNRAGETYYSFQGIPYASPPVGDLRFMPPQEATTWNGTRDATSDLPSCYQQNEDGEVVGQEDCLYLNVYTPEIPNDNSTDEDLKDVMVFIHGGGFNQNSGGEALYSPEFIINQDIVLVTINYRLGIFGAFNIDNSSEYTGNLQMKDQVAALQWVQSNIRNFGGNPNSVTIFGESAGGASVHYHILSPMSAGLFHKAILESGNAFAPWTAGIANSGISLAEALEIPTDDFDTMITELKNLTSQEILAATLIISATQSGIGYPIVEQVYENQTAFLTEEPSAIIESADYNQVPMIIGYNDAEGISYYPWFQNISSLLPSDLNLEVGSDEESALIQKIEAFYFTETNTTSNNTAIINLYTDTYFSYPTYRAATEHFKQANNSIYFYRFSADTNLNVYKLRNEDNAIYAGATHADELGYLFNTTMHYNITGTIEDDSIEDRAITRLVTLWTNFAKTGNPTPDESQGFQWLPISEDAFNYIDFGSNETTVGVDPDSERLQFWSDIYNGGIINQPSLMIMLSTFLLLIKMNFFAI